MKSPRVRASHVAEVASALILMNYVGWLALSWHQEPDPAVRDGVPPARSVRVHVDTCAVLGAERESVRTACRLPDPRPDGRAVWNQWVWLDGTPVFSASSDVGCPVRASRIADGFAFCVSNHSTADALAGVTISLDPGVYSVERLSFPLGSAQIEPTVDRLQPVIAGKRLTASRPASIPAGSAVIYRITNRAARARTAYNLARERAERLRAAHAPESRRIAGPMREAGIHIGAITRAGGAADMAMTLRRIHRALLTTAYALSISGNSSSTRGVPQAAVNDMRTSLLGLEDALAEWSAACFGIVPTLTLNASRPEGGRRDLVVSVANAGARSVTRVRVWMEAAAGAAMTPAVETSFGTLTSRQSARAAFTVTMPEAYDVRGICANISYYHAGAPAHLRLRPFAF